MGEAVRTAAEMGATAVSNSYGLRELELGWYYNEEEKLAWDFELANYWNEVEGEAFDQPSTAVVAASGDTGYLSQNLAPLIPDSKFHKCTCSPEFPASLPFVISVGGTQLHTSEDKTNWQEDVWSGTGSGCSFLNTKPSWQYEVCNSKTAAVTNDVAAVADNVSVYDTYGIYPPGWLRVGGTSASTPIIASTIALAGGLGEKGIKALYEFNPSTFYWKDITNGKNGFKDFHYKECEPEQTLLCHAGFEYDGPTGLGVPDGKDTQTPPGAVTRPPTSVTKSAAKLQAVLNPEELSTTYRFQWGTTTAYGSETAKVNLGASTAASHVEASISGLAAGTVYHYRVIAESNGGLTIGWDQVFSTAPKVHLQNIAHAEAEQGGLDDPRFLVADVQGNNWITDYEHDRVVEYSPEGKFIKACGGSGSGEGQLNGPTGIGIAFNQNRIYVSDSLNNRIILLTPSNCKISTLTTGLSEPMGISGDRNSEFIYVADSGNNRIAVVYGLSGAVSRTYGGNLNQPSDVLTIGDVDNDIKRFQFYVVDSGNNRIQLIEEKFDPFQHTYAYSVVNEFGAAQLSNPQGIGLDPTTSSLLVSDAGSEQINEFTMKGEYVASFGSVGSGPQDVADPMGMTTGSKGQMLIADTGNDRISVWTGLPAPPEAISMPASGLAEGSPRLNASVNPHKEKTTYYFEYDTKGYSFGEGVHGTKIPLADKELEAGSQGVDVNEAVTGLKSKTTYHFRVVATNGTGTTVGDDQSFTTCKAEKCAWSTPATPNPAPTTEAKLEDVSCPSSTLCLAAGADNYTKRGFGRVWNGSEWTNGGSGSISIKKTTITPHGISCASTTSCIVVGNESNNWAAAESWALFGSEWWGLGPYASMPQPEGGTSAVLNDVSCTSTSTCTAVGSYVKSNTKTLAMRKTEGGWSIQTTVDPSEVASELLGVSCDSATSCTAVGTSGGKTFAERWNGTSWSVSTTPNPSGGELVRLEDVSCTSSSFCVAVGSYRALEFVEGKPVTRRVPLAEHWNGSSWSIQSTAQPAGQKGDVQLQGVSCVSSSACTAVGRYVTATEGGAASEERTLAEIWNGSSWTVQSTTNVEGKKFDALAGVSCSASNACSAVGNGGPASSWKDGTVALAERYE